jgi:hypothetical protein
MWTNPLDESVELCDTPVWVRIPYTYEPTLFFEGDRFLDHIQAEYATFDVLTYSVSKAVDAPLRRISRLITNLPILSRSGLRPKEVRIVPNNHAKLFLCYCKSEVLQAVYLGSQNLSHGTQINIMYRADYLHNKPLLAFYDKLWKAARKP